MTITTPPESALAVGVTVTLTGEEFACAACGVVTDAAHVESVTVNTFSRDGRLAEQHVARFGRCAGCRERRQRAETLAHRYPSLAAAQGARQVALDRFDAVLAVGEMLGAPVRVDDAATGFVSAVASAKELSALLQHALVPAMSLAYSRQPEGREGTANAAPWGHVTPEHRSEARRALAAWLKARVDKPRFIPVPTDSDILGCAACGVGSVAALASESAEAWHSLDLDPRAFGGRRQAERLWVHVCPRCTSAIETHGVGVTALEAALFAHLGIRVVPGSVEARVTGFAALPLGTPANDTPWGHIDTAALKRDLASMGAGA
ncbi:hypothetical protein [Microbacterium sp.]|uniref:hypothetical protein n=1 Tax=Microbacterium sp. TaxID=51671 RepID=UPI003C78B972